VYREVREGRLCALRLGRRPRLRFRLRDVEAFEARSSTHSGEAHHAVTEPARALVERVDVRDGAVHVSLSLAVREVQQDYDTAAALREGAELQVSLRGVA